MKRLNYLTGLAALAALSFLPMSADAAVPQGTVVYQQNFDEESSKNSFTIIDSNSDNTTWVWRTDDGNGVMACFASSKESDDWLVTPAISVKAGKVYQISFRTWGGGFTDYSEKMELAYGVDTSVGAFKTITKFPAISHNGINGNETFKPTTTGNIHLGFHSESAANQFGVYLDDIVVREVSSSAAPSAVMMLNATTPGDASHQATVSFNAPLVDNSGAKLSSLTKIEVYRDTILAHTFSAPKPGASLSFTDKGAVLGVNTYTVVAYNAAGIGVAQSTSVFVGPDVPGEVSDVKLVGTNTGYTLSWKAPTAGATGKFFDPKAVSYNIYKVVDYKKTLVKTVKTTSTPIEDNAEKQSLATYAVSAVNEAGEGETEESNEMLMGKAYSLPIVQNFEGFNKKWNWMNDYCTDDDNHYWWRVDSPNWTHFSPGSTAMWWTTGRYDDETYFNTGKIDFRMITKPVLKFDYNTASTSGIQVEALKNDQTVEKLDYVDNETTGSTAGTDGWKTRNVDLSSLKGLNNVVIRFHGMAQNDGDKIGIDNIAIIDQVENNLAVTIEAPSKGYAAKESEVKVNVVNYGKPASGYTVKLYVNDAETGSQTVSDELATDATNTLSFKVTPQVGVKQLAVYATVDYAADEFEADDTTKTDTIAIEQPNMEKVNDLHAAVDRNTEQNVLAWSAVKSNPQTVTDDMESYPAFTIPGDGHNLESEYNIGPWYNYDADQEYSLDVPGYSFPWEEEAFAFITFNRNNVKADSEDVTPASKMSIFEAHSGNQFLAAFTMKDDMAMGTQVSDWLISPLLTGDAQTMDFWFQTLNKKNGTAWFQVAYSTTNNHPESFTNVVVDSVTANSSWTDVKVSLPAGAKYFAIHNITPVGPNQILMIDDITYTTGTGAVLGYKVYRDGKYLATVSEPNYTDAEGGVHDYNVTVLYNSGESALSNTASITTGINAITTDAMLDASAPRYNLAGQRVGNSYHGVVIQNGKKFIVK